MMDDNMLDPERLSIPRWTIARDTRSLGCVFCHSIIVRVTTDTRQVAFCSCRLVEYRLLPKPTSRKANSAKRHRIRHTGQVTDMPMNGSTLHL